MIICFKHSHLAQLTLSTAVSRESKLMLLHLKIALELANATEELTFWLRLTSVNNLPSLEVKILAVVSIEQLAKVSPWRLHRPQ